MDREPNLYGCLLGVAIGDSLGLPFEGLSDRRITKRLGSRPLRQTFLLGRGMLSDDTEQSCLVIEAFRLSEGDVQLFQQRFAKRLIGWFLAIPAGIGLATIKSCLRLLVGVPPNLSGVRSAGNGAAMRAPVLGALFPHDAQARRTFCDACSIVTHTDQRAIDGARVMAESVALSPQVVDGSLGRNDFLAHLTSQCESQEWKAVLSQMEAKGDAREFAKSIGSFGKVTGYVMQSVPVAIYIWLSEPQKPRSGLETAIRLGGDTDTVGAMLGALYGASLGPNAFPDEWRNRISDYPRSASYLEGLTDFKSSAVPKVLWPLCLIRNMFFLLVVVAHGLRRLLP